MNVWKKFGEILLLFPDNLENTYINFNLPIKVDTCQ